jgi:hypothetical protein
MLNLALWDVNMHNKVRIACMHIIMACVVCIVLAQHKRFWLLRAQCGYMLSHDSLVNCGRKVLVCGGGVLKSGLVQCVE